MCRHLAYVGPPRPVRDFVFDAPHALVHQGRAPREMVVAKDNPDGWGVAWWPPGAVEPRRYRTTTVMWEDTGFTAGDEKAVALLAAVRKASPNTTLDAVNNAPFVADVARRPARVLAQRPRVPRVVRGTACRARSRPGTPARRRHRLRGAVRARRASASTPGAARPRPSPRSTT